MGNNKFSIASVGNRRAFRDGARDGVPIALGYFAVSFSLGIVARNVGMTPIQGMITSALCNASAGEYAGFTMIAAGAAYIEMAIVTLIANARYLLMSCAMSQRMDPDMPFFHRLLMAFDITDELFGITIARPGYLNPWYMYGAIALAVSACIAWVARPWLLNRTATDVNPMIWKLLEALRGRWCLMWREGQAASAAMYGTSNERLVYDQAYTFWPMMVLFVGVMIFGNLLCWLLIRRREVRVPQLLPVWW